MDDCSKPDSTPRGIAGQQRRPRSGGVQRPALRHVEGRLRRLRRVLGLQLR